ncbi:hypothetical protein L3V82_10640 [Thiotrichales bacterium 19S3-7]|nr:hypothetical protein [Thiotrichales bacterium 19S3-7]MCF6802614.1 hypothetical protein [Thiotrichales bacterium 19S3-11]
MKNNNKFINYIMGIIAICILILPTGLYASDKRDQSWWDFIKGETPTDSLYLGMWSYHVSEKHPFRDYNYKNNMIGISYKSLTAGTFINSFHQRSYTVGIRRNLWEKKVGDWNFQAGYNLGIVYGYKDGKGMFLSDYSPVIPVGLLYLDITYHNVGVSLSTVGDVFMVGFKVEF